MIAMTEQDRFTRQGRRFLHWTRLLLVLTGVLALAYVGLTLLSARSFQDAASQTLDKQVYAVEQHPGLKTRKPLKEGDVVGRIEIPKIGMSVMILQGTTSRTLRLGAGHIEGTALPGEAGNVGIAGHRDTFFRRLKDLHNEDEILLQTTAGIAKYKVNWVQITAPGDGAIVASTSASALTLVTCYPFHYIGAAPERYVIHAIRQ